MALHDAARTHGAAPALADGEVRLDWTQLLAEVQRTARSRRPWEPRSPSGPASRTFANTEARSAFRNTTGRTRAKSILLYK
ncbi:hypothetical protein, partial [Nocardia farcinica]|uniref:hypothetical protein n=1 Tax=Nocardia farcinica TaxID=37329 RepID=UPI0024562989